MTPQSTGQPGAGHAVVIGGSMAGLLAARVLAGHFDRVTVVERDRLPDAAEHRRGVPQGRQIHALLARGLQGLERMFPGFGRELEAAGAVPIRMPADVLILTRAGWVDRRAPGWLALSATRPLIEATVRRRLRELPNVTVLDGYEATGLRASDDGRLVHGVALRSAHGTEGPPYADADLVVDASGRGSRTPTWLAELGHGRPEATTVDAGIAYAGRLYRIPDDAPADWKGLMIFGDPVANPRTGYLFPVEGGRLILGLMGTAGSHPPTDEAGYNAYMRRLRHPVLADALADAEPLTDIRSHHGTSNRRWHFERMRTWPERFVVLGDAVCAFDPVYGQGMSSAVIAAESLDECLRNHRRRRPEADVAGLARRFQRLLARRHGGPWRFSTGEDLRYPATTGGRTGPVMRAQHRYFNRLEAAATYDPAVADVYIRAIGMLERPTVLLRPRIVAAAVRARVPA
jgi:2-polyprenyl-6-methoxyphenol hydroxylase-like FAD-dependent oxidoreductase